MPRASYTQSGFLGGLWSPLAQGRFDSPFYKQALNVCLNGIITEEGPWTRRSGTETLGPTYLRQAVKFLPFQSEAATPLLMEFTSDGTNGYLRFWYGTGIVCVNQAFTTASSTSSSAGIITLTQSTAQLAVGDHCLLYCPVGTVTGANAAVVQNRHLKVLTRSGVGNVTVTLADDLGTALPSNITSGGLDGAKIFQVMRFSFSGLTMAMLPTMRAIQAQTQSIILSSLAPQVVTLTAERTTNSDPTLTFAPASFVDGPYLDPQPDTGTVSAYTGTITFTPASSTFVAADVGRCIRLFSQPAAWASGTTYTNGQYVTDAQGEWWVFTYSSGLAGVIPGTSYTDASSKVTYLPWAPVPGAGQWAWGTITAQAGTSCTVSLTTNLNSTNGSTISSWQLGVYKAGQYPTCGVYHEGRLWLAGAVPNRFDASMSNAPLTFSPTDVNGNVLDNSALSETLNFDDLSDVYWMIPDHQGVLVGTNGGEILLAASALNDPLTPTSIQAHRVSKYMAANVEPRRAGLASIFVQRYTQRVLEHMADAFTGKFSARHLNEFAKSLTATGVKELAYQEEKAPIVWSLMNDGSLAGCTYRRVSRFSQEPPVMQAWHQHALGDGSMFTTMCVLPGTSGLSDTLYLGVEDSSSYYWVEMLRPIFEDA
ncbi:MAG TPA: hypothetical protein VGR45_14330 [Stellaceae bacterium]|nr:hypothetical protein [Stellaceae bacterium]